MPEQLFLFEHELGQPKLLIGARDEREARGMLAQYLEDRPCLLQDGWILSRILGKVAWGIFTLT